MKVNDRRDLVEFDTSVISITFSKYKEPYYGIIKLVQGRYSFNLGKFSIIIEKWWRRK